MPKHKTAAKSSKPVRESRRRREPKPVSENVLALRAARDEVKRLIDVVRNERSESVAARKQTAAERKAAKAQLLEQRKAARAERYNKRIQLAQAKLDKLLNPPQKEQKEPKQPRRVRPPLPPKVDAA